MTPRTRNNLIAYGVLIGICLAVALIGRVRPELFANGPPSWQFFLSLRGTAVIALFGLIDIFFPTGAPVVANRFTPTAALVKATLLSSARQMTGAGAIPNG